MDLSRLKVELESRFPRAESPNHRLVADLLRLTWHLSKDETGTSRRTRLASLKGRDWHLSKDETGTSRRTRLAPLEGRDWHLSKDETGISQRTRLASLEGLPGHLQHYSLTDRLDEMECQIRREADTFYLEDGENVHSFF